jgi:hypothetical protein
MPKAKTTAVDEETTQTPPSTDPTPAPIDPPHAASNAKKEPEMVQISKEQWDQTQKMLEMLYETADKGRIFQYESQRASKKPIRVKLSVYQGKIITGWATIKDKAVYHPTTGKQVGEEQQYSLMLLDKEGKVETLTVDGYPTFSAARYSDRIECEVVSKKEDFDGNLTFEVALPDGRTIPLSSRFVN